MRAFGTPSASVSPSAAPVKVKFAVAQVAGFNAGKGGLKVIERCSVMGVPPPIANLPDAEMFPVTVWSPVKAFAMSNRA